MAVDGRFTRDEIRQAKAALRQTYTKAETTLQRTADARGRGMVAIRRAAGDRLADDYGRHLGRAVEVAREAADLARDAHDGVWPLANDDAWWEGRTHADLIADHDHFTHAAAAALMRWRQEAQP